MRRLGWFPLLAIVAAALVGGWVALTWNAFPDERLPREPSAAASALKNTILPAEVQCQAGGAIDDNRNGLGEYGFLSELSGLAPVPASATAPAGATTTLAFLAPAWRAPVPTVEGYRFAVYLPDGPDGALSDPYPLHARGDPGNAGLRESHWIAYAWPADHRFRFAFAIDQSGTCRARFVPDWAHPDRPIVPPAWNALYTPDAVPGQPPPTPGTWNSPVSPDWKPWKR
jgi:hypothetical protein